jgi:hypothetical protein
LAHYGLLSHGKKKGQAYTMGIMQDVIQITSQDGAVIVNFHYVQTSEKML